MESANALKDSTKTSVNAYPSNQIPIHPATPTVTWLLTSMISKRDVWLAQMDACPVLPAILAHNADQSIIIALPEGSALRFVVMEKDSLWPVMMETTMMAMVARKIVRSSLDSTVLVAHPTLLTSAPRSYLLLSSSPNQAKPTSPTEYS
jgi:hypothetical protein